MELVEIKDYLKIDFTDDDLLVDSLKTAAEIYLINCGVTATYTNHLYCLAIKLLVAHWYDNRAAEVMTKTTKLSFSLDTIISQLKYCGGTV